jgi:galactoside O-acetyltransferase
MKPIISPNIRIRHIEDFLVGEYSIVDDYCYFSTKVKIGKCSHIASGCSVAGGKERLFILGDYCSLSSGVKIWCTSDDFTNDIVTIIPPDFGEIKNHLIIGDVIIGNLCAVGSNSVIMPNNSIPEGTIIGALSFVPVNFKFEPWGVYAGIPIRFIKYRNKENVMKQFEELEKKIRLGGNND